jgi:F-type H+-transporting ATPase subunit b
MRFDWWTLALQTVNFAVLVWLLRRFLYRPVLRMVDARRAEIDRQDADVHAMEAKAKEQLAAIEAERAGIAAERETALKAAATEADESAKARRAQVEREAEALLDGARKTLATERDQALAEARRAALELGAEFARRLLAEVPTQLRAEAWLQRMEQHLAALAAAERSALVAQCVDGAGLTVVTAAPLPSMAEETWRSRLGRPLGAEIAMKFVVDPALVSGTELHFPNSILRFSWQSALATLRAEVDDVHAH